MNFDQTIKLIDALAKLLSILLWPGVVVWLIIKLGPSLNDFFANLGEFTFKGAGVEATAQRTRVATALAAAELAQSDDGTGSKRTDRATRNAAEIVAGTVSARTLREINKSKILWVDAQPRKIEYERDSLLALGVELILARSPKEALELVENEEFDLIISEMDFPDGSHEGFRFFEHIRNNGNKIPFIFYSQSPSIEYAVKAVHMGALGIARRASELFLYTIRALQDRV